MKVTLHKEIANSAAGNSNENDIEMQKGAHHSAQQLALKLLRPAFSGISKEAVAPLNVPVRVMTEEGVALERCARRDEMRLRKVGLNWSQVEGLTQSARALSEAQSQWDNVRFTREDEQKTLRGKMKEADTLRADLVHTMRFAFRHDEELLSRVNRIAEGTGKGDLAQDLNDLAVLGRENPQPLEAVGMDLEQLVTASDMSDALQRHKAEVAVNETAAEAKKLLRDQAYTYLKQAMDAVREHGQYAFWKSPEKLLDYSSAYLRDIRKRSRSEAKSKDAKAPEAPDSETPKKQSGEDNKESKKASGQ